MKKYVRKIIFALLTLMFSLFNIYKSLRTNYSSTSLKAFFKFSSYQNSLEAYNNSKFEYLFQLDHTPLQSKLSLLGKPHNQSHYPDVYDENARKLPFWRSVVKDGNYTKQKDAFGDDIEEYYFLVVVLQVCFFQNYFCEYCLFVRVYNF